MNFKRSNQQQTVQEGPESPCLSAASHPIQILVNYWEIQVPAMGARLDELVQNGVHHIASFVPWQSIESDISHTFPKFLQGVRERGMTLSLIVTPEVGVHFPNSGLPRDILSKTESLALHEGRSPIIFGMPPNRFAAPSLLSADFTKRYYGFLSRMDTLLADFEKSQAKSLDFLTLVMTGSYWKYYRAPSAENVALREPPTAFSGACGDYSAAATVGFRARLDDFFSHPEFSGSSPSNANRWKTREREAINRLWFYQQCEAVFRNRTEQQIRKRSRGARFLEVELFTPEADPTLVYLDFLKTLAAGDPGSDFSTLSNLVDEASSFGSMAANGACASFVHWSSLGGFHALGDSERQFLVLKSLLLLGGLGGGLLIDEAEWFSFSRGFRQRAESFSRILAQGDLSLKSEAFYWVPHLWSGSSSLWGELRLKAGHAARKIASQDWIESASSARLVIVDPSVILTQEAVKNLISWAAAEENRVVALPRSNLYSDEARAELEALHIATVSSGKRPRDGSRYMDINLGVPYRLYAVGEGKIVLFELPETRPAAELKSSDWSVFLSSMLSIAGICEPCRVSDSRLSVIPLNRQDGSLGLFILNGSLRPVSGDIIFQNSVSVSDLATEVASQQKGDIAGPRKGVQRAAAQRFSLDVPPCGVLPLAVDRVGLATPRENNAADALGALGEANALAAAVSELPGFDPQAMDAPSEGAQVDLWN